MNKIEIREISIKDLNTLKEIGKQTFIETFSLQNSEEDLKEYIKKGFSTEKLRTELKDKNSIFYFAEFDNITIGYLKINLGDSQTELKDKNTLEIERIYVLKEFHGKRIGQLLFEKAIEIAKRKMVEYVWLSVWEENPKAIRFYEKNGFIEFNRHIFKLGNDEQTDLMMKLKMN